MVLAWISGWPTDRPCPLRDSLATLASIQLHRAVQHRSTIEEPSAASSGLHSLAAAQHNAASTAQTCVSLAHDSGKRNAGRAIPHMLIEPNLRVLRCSQWYVPICAHVWLARVKRRESRVPPCVSNGSGRQRAFGIKGDSKAGRPAARQLARHADHSSFLSCAP